MGSALLLQYFVICLNLVLAFLVLFNKPGNMFNRSFFVFALGAVIWIFCADMVSIEKNFIFFRPTLCGAEIMILGFVLLAKFFPDGTEDGGRIKKKFLLFLLPWFVTFIATFSQLVIRFADINNDGYLDAISGVLFPVRFVVLAGYLIWGIVIFLRKYKKLARFARVQNLSFLIGAGLFVTATLLCDLLFPVFHIFSLVLIGILFSLVLVACVAYGIMRYQLMDIRLFIKRSVVYLAAISIIALFYFSASFFLQEFLHDNDTLTYPASAVAAAVLCVFGFLYLKREFEEMTDRFFFRGEYDYFTAMRRLEVSFYSTIDITTILKSIGKIFSETIKPEQIIFFLDSPKCSYFFDCISGAPPPAASEAKYKEIIDDFQVLSSEPLFMQELERAMEDFQPRRRRRYRILFSAAKKSGIAAIIPIFSKEKATAILLLGEKRSGSSLSQKDKEFLSSGMHQAGMAIENAMLYEKIKDYADALERRVLERTERIKSMYEGQSRFLADLSHEFQTPISILKGNIECLVKTNNLKGKNELYTIGTTLDRLSRLIENLLGIAQLSSSKSIIERKRISAEKLLEETYDDCLILASDRKITLSFSSEKCFIFGNADKLKEVLLNLVSNALKYTPPGGSITLSARTVDDEIEIRVSDTGPGISRKNIPRVFERFYKINAEAGGTGLGLYICRRIIEAHNGTITVESAPGKGSCFNMRLPPSPTQN